jgi:hypothetical protein
LKDITIVVSTSILHWSSHVIFVVCRRKLHLYQNVLCLQIYHIILHDQQKRNNILDNDMSSLGWFEKKKKKIWWSWKCKPSVDIFLLPFLSQELTRHACLQSALIFLDTYTFIIDEGKKCHPIWWQIVKEISFPCCCYYFFCHFWSFSISNKRSIRSNLASRQTIIGKNDGLYLIK